MSISSFRRICCYHSTFFYKTFNGNFKEGTEQRITLETRTANFQMGHPVDAYKRDFRSQLRQLRRARKITHVSRVSCSCRSNRLLGPFDSVTASNESYPCQQSPTLPCRACPYSFCFLGVIQPASSSLSRGLAHDACLTSILERVILAVYSALFKKNPVLRRT